MAKMTDRVGDLGMKVGDLQTRVGDVGGYLKEQRELARLSLRQLASIAGVSNPYLSQIERGLRKPSAEVLQQIAKGLQISAEALFLRAGFLEDSGGPGVEVAIHSDARLTSRQKRVLLDIYSTFLAENDREAPPEADEPAAPVTADTEDLLAGPSMSKPVSKEPARRRTSRAEKSAAPRAVAKRAAAEKAATEKATTKKSATTRAAVKRVPASASATTADAE